MPFLFISKQWPQVGWYSIIILGLVHVIIGIEFGYKYIDDERDYIEKQLSM